MKSEIDDDQKIELALPLCLFVMYSIACDLGAEGSVS